MAGQFQNKQFGGDQFAGAEFGPDGGSGARFISASIGGAGALAADLVGVEETRRPARLRQIREGYVCPAGVHAPSYVGKVRAHGVRRQGIPAQALPQGLHSRGAVGALFVSGTSVGGEAKAIPSTPRAVRGHAGIPLARGEARGACVGVSGKAKTGTSSPCGGACAYPEIRGSKGGVGTVRAGAIQNPTNEEILAVLVAVRARRKTRRLTTPLSERRLPPVSNHSHSLRQ